MVVSVAPEKFLLCGDIPPRATGDGHRVLRGPLEDEPRSHYRRRVWIGTALSVGAWHLVASTIAVPLGLIVLAVFFPNL